MQNPRPFHSPNRVISRDFWFGFVDSRPLSAFRLCFALLLLKDALYHLPIAAIFYGDRGVLPRLVLWDGLAAPNQFSLMDALADDWMVVLFFMIWAGVAACLFVGYRTRQMSILNFIIILSVHHRNVYVLTGADTVMRVLSFWSMFLPLDHYYSLNSLIGRPASDDRRTTYAFPLRIIQLQVALIYLVTGILKLMGSPWRSGDALFTVLQIKTMLLPLGQWLGTSTPYWCLQLITYSVLGFELAFIVLSFVPVAQPTLKAVTLGMGTLLHLGIALTMVMPMTDFSLLMVTSYLLFFEPQWINWIDDKTRLFTAPILAQLLRFHRLGLGGAAHLTEMHVKPEDVSPGLARFLRIALTICLAGMIVLVLWWNLNVIGGYADPPFLADYPAWSSAAIRYTGLWQSWDMFSPVPLQKDGWIRIPGQFEDGTQLDLFDLQAAESATVPPAINWGPDMRWQKYISNIYDDPNDNLLRAWGRYYCRLYNTAGNLPRGARLATLEIHYMFRRVYKYGEAISPLQDDLLWSHWCFEEYAPK